MNSKNNIEKNFKSIIQIKNKSEKIQLMTEFMHLKIMNEISKLMKNRSINKTQLADKLHVSKSYVTQLFTADKIINLNLLSIIQDAYDVTFNFTLDDNFHKSSLFTSSNIINLSDKISKFKKMELPAGEDPKDFHKFEFNQQISGIEKTIA